MGKERVAAFSDGVIAIIITIMVLELKVPHGDGWAALGGQAPHFVAYVLSFIDVFMLLTLLFAVLAFGTMLMQRPQGVGEGAGH